MGSYILSYGIKTKEIQNVFGSKNKAILNRVQSGKTFQDYESEIKDSSISLTNDLAEIIKGRSMSDRIVEVFKSRPKREMNDKSNYSEYQFLYRPGP